MKENNYKLRGYISTNRSKHNLKAHLILVCKYRKKLLKGDMNYFIKSKIEDIAESRVNLQNILFSFMYALSYNDSFI